MVAGAFEVRSGPVIKTRLQRLRYLDWPDPKIGRGRQVSYGPRSIIDTVTAFALIDAGFDVDTAAAVCKEANRVGGTVARRVVGARGRRGDVLVVSPTRLSTASGKAAVPSVEMIDWNNSGVKLGHRASVCLDLGALGERITEAIVNVGICDKAALEVALSRL